MVDSFKLTAETQSTLLCSRLLSLCDRLPTISAVVASTPTFRELKFCNLLHFLLDGSFVIHHRSSLEYLNEMVRWTDRQTKWNLFSFLVNDLWIFYIFTSVSECEHWWIWLFSVAFFMRMSLGMCCVGLSVLPGVPSLIASPIDAYAATCGGDARPFGFALPFALPSSCADDGRKFRYVSPSVSGYTGMYLCYQIDLLEKETWWTRRVWWTTTLQNNLILVTFYFQIFWDPTISVSQSVSQLPYEQNFK